ncbi:dynein intermediate chain 4, axonemal-like [Teleopsis dalmanni]|nr:dynein intermediate chain 4, axonemal-like [Teleopsis dalmanni]
MELPSRLDKEHELKYKIEILFEFPQPGNLRRSMADIDFCPSNGDIFAVAYGIFSFSASTVPKSGQVCIWSVKNPENPERIYNYPLPCTAVKFSQFLPSLIAIGLYDGNVEVRDITFPDMPPVSVSNPETLSGCESIVTIRWIKKNETDGSDGIDPFLSLAQDGCVTKFRIVSGPYLISYAQMILERVEGKVEGIQIREPRDAIQFSSQSPQGLNLTVHPTAADIYYIMTDEGCIYKCSTSYAHQYLDVIRAHRSAVNMLDFSPWSPKVYLTCGNDWCIRVWVEGIYKPLITLKDQFTPLNCAYWSRTHSTIIIAINRKTVDIWDIRRNLLKPISSTNLQSSFQTTAKIAKCGHSIAVGNERGTTMMCQLVDMPYEPHFQYDELEKAIFKAIALHPDLINELRNIGYFGYKNKGQVLPP